ncbi:MAG: glycosyltransferase family 2 protein [Deltaproteobacteria bacterium]|nr:glycosyltransferase family 2 protein [Deltaproteobacteria bacterium]
MEQPETVPKKVVVVVPAYNEAQKIGEAVAALRAQAEAMTDVQLLVYVINDGSSDETGALATEAGADRVLHHKVNRGLGAAVRTGLSAARDDGADIAVKFDADLQHDPADIPKMLQPINDDEADVVYGNRFDRIEYKMPLVRRTGNLVFTRLMAWLTGWRVQDSQPGILAVSRAYLSNFYLPGDYNYTQQILLDAYHKGMRFAHVSVAFRKRVSGKSFVSFRYPFKVLPQIVMVLVGVRPLRVFAPIGLLFFLFGVVLGCVELSSYLFGDAAKPVQHVNLVMGTSLFGLQTLFFGLIADLIVKQRR